MPPFRAPLPPHAIGKDASFAAPLGEQHQGGGFGILGSANEDEQAKGSPGQPGR
jgi:hypothetical protein